MHQTNQRGHNETSTATTQNQLAYKACRRWREVSARPDATATLNILGYNTLTNTLLVTRHIRSRRIPEAAPRSGSAWDSAGLAATWLFRRRSAGGQPFGRRRLVLP
jgi:hypothetical protein